MYINAYLYILMNNQTEQKDITLWIFIVSACTLMYIIGFSLCIIMLIGIIQNITI